MSTVVDKLVRYVVGPSSYEVSLTAENSFNVHGVVYVDYDGTPALLNPLA